MNSNELVIPGLDLDRFGLDSITQRRAEDGSIHFRGCFLRLAGTPQRRGTLGSGLWVSSGGLCTQRGAAGWRRAGFWGRRRRTGEPDGSSAGRKGAVGRSVAPPGGGQRRGGNRRASRMAQSASPAVPRLPWERSRRDFRGGARTGRRFRPGTTGNATTPIGG